MIYLDNAATTAPKPKSVVSAVSKALMNLSANPGRSGHLASSAAAEAVFNCRVKLAGFFSAPNPENVIFTNNCTHSINMVLKGYLNKGDHVITSNLEHNAVMRPLEKLSNQGISYDTAEVSLTHKNDTVKAFEKLIKPQTKLIICTHASNVLGVRLPVEEIGKLCSERNIAFAVDAAQSAGVLPIHMQSMNIDFLCIAPHKGLYAPMGTGVLIAGRPLDTLIEGGTGTSSADYFQPEEMPERFESGTVNVPGIAGISAGLDFIAAKGINKIHEYESGLARILYASLQNIENIKLYTPMPDKENYTAVVSFNLEGASSEAVAASLSDGGIAVRAGLHCAPSAHKFAGTIKTGTVRVSISIFNTSAQIEQFVHLLKKIAKNYNKKH